MINPNKFPFTIALDMVEKRAACVILQGVYGTSAPTEATLLLRCLGPREEHGPNLAVVVHLAWQRLSSAGGKCSFGARG